MINWLHNTFEQVTDHYGIRYERVWGELLYVVYFVRNGKICRCVTARTEYYAAVSECEYLEKLNSSKWS